MADTLDDNALRVLLGAGRPEELRQLLDRVPDVLRPMLAGSGPVPPSLVDAVVTTDGPELARLAGNKAAQAADPRLRARLAESGHPLVAATAFYHDAWLLPELRTLFAAADPADPRWHTKPAGPARQLSRVFLSRADRHRCLVLRAALVSPFPELVAHALREYLPGGLTRAERLRGVLSLLVHGGPTALADLLADLAPGALPDDELALARSALAEPDGPAGLRAAAVAAEGPAGLRDELYGPPDQLPHALAVRPELDWAAVLGAHATQPLPTGAIRLLAARPDCTDERLTALCAGHPNTAELLAGLDRPAPLAPLTALPVTKETRALLATTVAYCVERDTQVDELLAAARPAVTVLEAVRVATAADARVRQRAAGLTDRLAALVAERLGDRVPAWRVLRQRIARFRGSVEELLTEAATRAEGGEGTDAAWPEPGSRPGFTDTVSVKGARAAFLVLLDVARPAVQWALLPHLDHRTAHELLVLGTWRPEWLDRALGAPDNTERMLLSRRRDLPAEAVTTLAGLDDPAVNAGLVYQRYATFEQRLALVAGRPFTPGRQDRLPNDAEVRAARTAILGKRDRKPWLGPWIASGDPELLDLCLLNVQMHSAHLQWRYLLGLWERHGPDGVRDRRPDWFQDNVRKTMAILLGQADEADALRRLRELTREAGTSKQLARRMRTVDRDLEWLLAEGFVWDWDELLAEHRRNPLPSGWVAELARLDGCPPELWGEPAAKLSRGEQSARDKLVGGQPVGKVLARTVLSPPAGGVSWAVVAVRQGLFSWSDLVEYGRPVRSVLTALACADGVSDEAARTRLRELVGTELAGDPEAWVLAVRMLPDFSGSLPELARTAALAALPPTGAMMG